MASPFRIFRKHQKVMIATLAILAMGAFVFLDPLMQLFGGGGGRRPEASNDVVIRWDDGEIRQWDLERMVQMRNIVNYFVSAASQLGSMASGAELPSFQGFGPATEQHVVRTMLLAQAARDFGFMVSDEVINRFLREITRESVPETRLRDIIARSSVGNRRVSMEMVFQALREELLAQELINNYMMSADSVLPSERWMTWLRINDRVTVATLPVPVEAFIDQVDDPSPEELQTFFDTYKDVVKRPVVVDGVQLVSPEPGFKKPRQVTLQYVRADYESFVDRLAEEIGDEEISAFYQRNKRRFVVPDLLEDDTSADATDADLPADADAPEPDQTDTSTRPAEEDSSPPATEQQTGDQARPDSSSEETKAEAPPSETPAPPTDSDDAPATTPPASPTDASAGDANRAAESEDPEETGNPAEATDEAPVDVPPAGDSANDGAPGEVPDSVSAEPADEQGPVDEAESQLAEPAGPPGQASDAHADHGADAASGDAAPADPKPREQEAPAADDVEKATTESSESSERPATEEDEDQPRYAPLEEVRDEIRRDLARQQAPEKMQELLSGWVSEMRRYYRKLQVWELRPDRENNQAADAKRPVPPDAGQWAEQHGVTFEKTAAVSSFELQDMDVGRSIIVGEGETLVSRAFSQMPAYQPVATEDILGNRYVVWKTSESAEKVPSLNEVREDVVRAWKMQRSRELARNKANELAEQARQAGKPLGDVFTETDGYQITRSDPFSWLTLGAVPGGRDVRLRLSEIYGVSQAGPAFMQTVFPLSKAEVAVAMNHPEDTAYVVQLVERERSREALREDFMKEAEVYVPVVQRQNRLAAMAGLVSHLSEAYDVEGWERLDARAQTP